MSETVAHILRRLESEYEDRLERADRAKGRGAVKPGDAMARDAHGLKLAIDIVKECVGGHPPYCGCPDCRPIGACQ